MDGATGWPRTYGMDSTKTEVLEEVSRKSYIRGVNDTLDAKR